MTTESDLGSAGSGDVREARRAIEAFLARTAPGHGEEPDLPQSQDPDADVERRRGGARVDDRVAEQVAREAWDAVQDVTPPAPDPAQADAGPAAQGGPSPELAERHRRAIAITRGLLELGYHLDETLRPGPDMTAG